MAWKTIKIGALPPLNCRGDYGADEIQAPAQTAAQCAAETAAKTIPISGYGIFLLLHH